MLGKKEYDVCNEGLRLVRNSCFDCFCVDQSRSAIVDNRLMGHKGMLACFHNEAQCLCRDPQERINDYLCIGINGCPSPAITSTFGHLFLGDVFLLRINKSPHFIALDAAHFDVAHGPIVVLSTGATHLLQESENRGFALTKSPLSRQNGC